MAAAVLGFFLPLMPANFGTAEILGAAEAAQVYEEGSLEEAIVAYHVRMNQLTNDYLRVLLSPDLDSAQLGLPADEASCEGYVSTYCLAVQLSAELTAFESAMATRLDDFDDLKSELQSTSTSVDLQTAIEAAAAQSSNLNEQLAYAQDTLDLTLAVYNQIQTIYPTHLEMQTFIENLSVFRDRLAQVRSSLEFYPSKFVGVSTARCQ